MTAKSPQEIAKEIILNNATGIDSDVVLMVRDEIAQAIQAERDLLTARIQVMDAHPGDILFVSTPDKLSDKAYEHISGVFKQFFPGLKTVILEGGMMINGVVRPETINEPG